MTKKLVALALAVLLAAVSYASTVVLVKKPAGGGHPADVLFWLNFEVGEDTAATPDEYDMHATNEYTAGDNQGVENTGSTPNNAAVEGASAKVGSFGLTSGCCSSANGTGDNFAWDVSSNDIISNTAGRVGFWWQHKGTWVNGNRFFQVRYAGSAADEFYVETVNTDDLRFCWEVTGQATRCATDTASTYVVDTWYYIEIVYDLSVPSLELRVDGASKATQGNSSAAQTCAGASCAQLRLGTSSGTAFNWLDQVVISNDKTHDLYTAYNATLNYP